MFPGPLRAFFETIRGGSIRKASESLGLAPSTVSRQIQTLEHQIGTALFDRSASGVIPTHAGKIVADYARSVLLDYDALRDDLSDLKGIRRGLIRITTVEGAVSEGAVAAIVAFRSKFDGVTFQLRIVPAPKVIDVVKLGEADIGQTFCGPAHRDLNVEFQVHDPIVLGVSSDHELAGITAIPLADLQSMKLAMPEPSFGIRRIVDQACHARGYILSPVLCTDSFEALRAFARQGAGAAVLGRLSISRDEKQGLLKSIIVEAPSLQNTTIDVITLKARKLSVMLKLFLVELKRIMQSNH